MKVIGFIIAGFLVMGSLNAHACEPPVLYTPKALNDFYTSQYAQLIDFPDDLKPLSDEYERDANYFDKIAPIMCEEGTEQHIDRQIVELLIQKWSTYGQ